MPVNCLRESDRQLILGGRTLNLYCSGEGAPTVILETGGNSPGNAWLLLQSKMAVFTRACWYDRAGVGGAIRHPLRQPGPLLPAICTRRYTAPGSCHPT